MIEWTLAYAALAYTVLHGVEMLSEAQGWPHVIVRVLSLVLILGMPVIAALPNSIKCLSASSALPFIVGESRITLFAEWGSLRDDAAESACRRG